MTDNPKSTFAQRVRTTRPQDKRQDIRDDVVAGLLIRVFPSGARTFTLERSVRGRRHYANLGDANTMTIPQARREARRLIAGFTEPTKQGNGPRTPGHPMTAFAEEFLERQAHRWKPRTRDTNTRIVRKDMVTIAKLLGHALVETTERYVHLSDQSVSEAADRVSARLSAALAGKAGNRKGRTRHAQS